MRQQFAWQKEDNTGIAIKIVLFFVSPFLSFLYSLRRMNTRSSYTVFFLFALFYGLCFTVAADTESVLDMSDAAKWRQRFENTNIYTIRDFLLYCAGYFTFAGEGISDLYFATVTFFVHQFSDNYHVFFFVLALVFIFFQLKSLRFLTSNPQFNNGFACLLLCALFTVNNISNIGGMRFWTAAWIGVYSLLELYINKRRGFLVVLFLLPLIHRGFFFLYPVLLLSLSYKWKGLWTIAYYLSFALSAVSVYIIRDATSYLPSFLTNMIEAYSENTVSEQYSFTKMFLTTLAQFYINVLFIVIMRKRPRQLPQDMDRLYSFTLVFLTIVNFVMPIPSLGVRFIVVCYSLIALLWISFLGHARYSILIYLMPLFMVRVFYVEIAQILRFQDLSFFFTNPITLLINHL